MLNMKNSLRMALIQRRLFSSASATSSSSNTVSTALVTGAGSGIGRAVCNLMAKRDAVNIIAADIRKEHADQTVKGLENSSSLTHVSLEVDVSSRDSVNEAFNQALKVYPNPPNIIVNCAGITRDAMMLKMTDEQLDSVLNVNIKGSFYPIQIGCRHMVNSKVPWGSIVNLSSASGKYGNIGQSNYAASKEGIIGLTKSVAKEMAKYNIRCNAVVPGFIETPMTETIPEHIAQLSVMLIALKRKGTAEEVAEAIAFLASQKSSYITGAALDVTGGFLM